MKKNRILILLSTTLAIAISIVACKDKFSEGDFLNQSNALKTQADSTKFNQQVKALNDAGELLSFTVQVVDDKTPLPGVAVTMSNDVANLTTTVNTDQNGNAVFTKVKIGSNSLSLSLTGYISATAVVDFGSVQNNVNYQVVYGNNSVQTIVPIKQTRSVQLPLFATGATAGASTGTIQGKVTIETDVTNKTPEVPQNLTIKANYAYGIASVVTGGSVDIISYSFNQAGIGVAKVDNTTGTYSMVVPASAQGLNMSLLFPTFDADQKIAAKYIDGTPIATGPQYMTVSTSFGPAIANDQSLPNIPGAKIVFPAPPAAGAGLGFTLTPVPTGLALNPFDTRNSGIYPNEGDPSRFYKDNTIYQLTSRGSGYTSSPTVTLSGGGTSPVPTQGTLKASLIGVLTKVAINAGGSGYLSGDNVTVNFRFKDGSNTNNSLFTYNATVTVNAGAITNLTFPTSGLGIDPQQPFQTASFSTGFNVVSFDAVLTGGSGSGATLTPTYSATVGSIALTNVGANYTSAPTVTFSGGGASTQAALSIVEFGTQWYVSPDNSANTSAYSLPPYDVNFEFATMNQPPIEQNSVFDQFGGQSTYAQHLAASGGAVIQKDVNKIYRTTYYNSTPPKFVVSVSQPTQAEAIAFVNSDGHVGSVSNINTGAGYNSDLKPTIQPAVTGAPGSGAIVDIVNYTTVSNGEYVWNGMMSIANQGSGYIQDLNMQNHAGTNTGAYGFQGNPGQFSVKTGETKIYNINYGTGLRKQNIN